jgi:NAD(P)-dependent dehydrogenase (short-subunit alcohol dehydrogenase family)
MTHPWSAFDLTDRVVVITGGAGLLGKRHAIAVARAGGTPVLVDLREADARHEAAVIGAEFGVKASAFAADISDPTGVRRLFDAVIARYERVDVLINNAANNPKLEDGANVAWSRLESFPLALWNADIAVGLTGAFLCSQAFGTEMARRRRGVILNVASDLALIAPDQRIYRREGLPEDQQPVKPVTYSVVKNGLVGLTRYLATYWAKEGVRVNALSPGGVRAQQPDEFVERLESLIPLGRMARIDEYEGAVLFLCSDASAYMTGTNLVIDGGRTCW